MSLWPICPIQLTLLSFQSETSWCVCHFSTKNIVSDSHCQRMKSRPQELSVSALCGLTLSMYSLTSSMIWLCPSPEDYYLTPAALFQDVCDPLFLSQITSLSPVLLVLTRPLQCPLIKAMGWLPPCNSWGTFYPTCKSAFHLFLLGRA